MHFFKIQQKHCILSAIYCMQNTVSDESWILHCAHWVTQLNLFGQTGLVQLNQKESVLGQA